MTVDYDSIASDYQTYRTPDERIRAIIYRELDGYENILNVGAGLGSYEPEHCDVIALEPSQEMIERRPSTSALAIQGAAENIPYPNNKFDVSMGILTIHHWQDLAQGLAEMKRVSKYKVLLLTWVDDSPQFWMQDYFPEMREIDRTIFPSLDKLESYLGKIKTEIVPIPSDCTDGFMCAYWQRPMEYLKVGVRGAISTFARMKDTEQGISKLKTDIESGAWLKKYGSLMNQSNLDLGYRLVTCDKNI